MQAGGDHYPWPPGLTSEYFHTSGIVTILMGTITALPNVHLLLTDWNWINKCVILKKNIEKLQSKYVFSPADKAANYVIIIWKKYYVEVLKGKLNFMSKYVPAQLTKNKLLLHHKDTLAKIYVKKTQNW